MKSTNLAFTLACALSAVLILLATFLAYEPSQTNKPGGPDATVVWWSAGKDVPCKHK